MLSGLGKQGWALGAMPWFFSEYSCEQVAMSAMACRVSVA
jgi:hypothetical protein